MDQKNLLLAALLSVIVLLGWSLLFPSAPPPAPEVVERPVAASPLEPAPPTGVTRAPATADPSGVAATQPVAPQPLDPVSDSVEREVEIDGASVTARFSNRGAQLVSLRLHDTEGRDGQPLEMVRRRAEGPYPFAIVEPDGSSSSLNQALFVIEPTGVTDSVRFVYRGPLGSATKEFRFHDDGLFDVDVTVDGRNDWSLLLGPGVRNPTEQEFASRLSSLRSASYLIGGEIETNAAGRASAPVILSGQGVGWVGLEDQYFLAVLAPRTPILQAVLEPMLPMVQADGSIRYEPHPGDALSEEQEDLSADYRILVQPGQESLIATSFWGSKRYEHLTSLPAELQLEKTVRWGFMGILALPLLTGLLWIHEHVVQNYGWSIVLLTLVIKVLMAPLTHKSYVSSRKMQAIQPKMQAIKQKYRAKLKDKRGRPNMENQRKQNEELQQLMRSEGVNPLGGCLPMLLQMPFFFAFFRLLQNSVELWNAPWAFWIADLSARDPLYILPLVMGASQFLQQRMIGTTSMEPAQRVMMNMMPIMFMFFFFSAPSGLVLYWVTSNLLTIVQQLGFRQLRSSGVIGGDDDEAPSKAGSKAKAKANAKAPAVATKKKQ